MKIAVVDNLDSFTYNLVHYLESLKADVQVFRSNSLSPADLAEFNGILLSPGPGIPADAKTNAEVLEIFTGRVSILGVCLGFQSIILHTGGQLFNLSSVLHGQAKLAQKTDENTQLLKDIPEEFQVGHYHSWAARKEHIPNSFSVSSINEDGLVMSIENPKAKLYGIQFHPESVLTPLGKKIIANWANLL